MSESGAEVVRRQFEALVSGGVDAAAEFWHADIEWRAVEGAADDVGVMRGADRVRRYYEDWIETFDDLRAEVVEVALEEGDKVVLKLRNSGRGRVSGVETHGSYYVACTVKDGRIASGREFESRERALAAVR
jgi:ketosteroid isomerase-like protein